MAMASQRYRDRSGKPTTTMLLDPYEDEPGKGGLSLDRDGMIVIDRIAGTLTRHGCAGYPFSCKYCGEQIIKLNAPPGIPERMMILDADPHDDGTVAISDQGWGVYDPAFKLEGARYHWHTKHQGGSGRA